MNANDAPIPYWWLSALRPQFNLPYSIDRMRPVPESCSCAKNKP